MAGYKVTHVKAHGALSNVACEEESTARAIASAIKAVDPNLVFVVLANSKLVAAGEAANLPMAHEMFADRAYEDDGKLVSRKKPGSVLHDPKQIAERVVRMVQDGAVVSVTGKVIKMRTDTICIHGDTPGAVDIARGVRQALKDAGIEVAPFKALSGDTPRSFEASLVKKDELKAFRKGRLQSARRRRRAPPHGILFRFCGTASAHTDANELPRTVRAWPISNHWPDSHIRFPFQHASLRMSGSKDH